VHRLDDTLSVPSADDVAQAQGLEAVGSARSAAATMAKRSAVRREGRIDEVEDGEEVMTVSVRGSFRRTGGFRGCG